PGEQVLDLIRVRYADGEPLAVMRNAIPERIAPSREALAASGLYACLREQGITMVLAHERIGATVADAEHAELLGEEVGAALLTMERKSFANDGSVVEYGYHVYRAARYSFEVTLVDSCAARREAWAGARVLATTARGPRAEARVTATLLCTSQPSPVLTCTKPSAPWPRDSGTHTQAGGPAVDGQQHPGGGTVAGGGEVAVRLGDLLG